MDFRWVDLPCRYLHYWRRLSGLRAGHVVSMVLVVFGAGNWGLLVYLLGWRIVCVVFWRIVPPNDRPHLDEILLVGACEEHLVEFWLWTQLPWLWPPNRGSSGSFEECKHGTLNITIYFKYIVYYKYVISYGSESMQQLFQHLQHP